MSQTLSDERLDDIFRHCEKYGKQETCDFYEMKEETLNRYLREHRTRFGESEPEKTIEAEIQFSGMMPNDGSPDPEKIFKLAIEHQQKIQTTLARKKAQSIRLPENKPALIACLSDLHLGNANVDYKQIYQDVELVANTPGAYAILAGDTNDNWIGKLANLQREQIMDFDSEIGLVRFVLQRLDKSLIAVVSGNHELRTYNLAGIDYLKWILENNRLLYDKYEIYFRLQIGDASWMVKVRHRWKGSSAYNDTHPIERDEKFGELDFDIGIGGHTHNGTLIRPFNHRNGRAYAVLIGTYLMDDRYAVQLGFKNSTGIHNTGCGALILWPNGYIQGWSNLEQAVDYLKFLRSK